MDKALMKQRKEMLQSLIKEPSYVPMKAKEIAILLDIPREQRGELQEVLDEMLAEGSIGVSKKGKYGKPEIFSLVGMFSGHPRGFGFVSVEGMERDVFIPEDKTGGALHGDRVQLIIEQEASAQRAEGKIIKVIEHANQEVVGYFQKNKNFGFVMPDNQRIGKDIFIPQGKDMGAVTGHKVVVKLMDFGGPEKNPEGVVKEIIGHVNDPGTDILSIVRAYNLPEEFPPEVMEEAKRAGDKVKPAEIDGRMDLRGLQTVTIDGEDAKDLDDAITLSKEGKIYRLGVHIADVTHYVKEGSALDQEALRRGTSVYLVDRVIPMLPHSLSNGICSLNQGEDRLALSCLMEIDQKGNVLGHELAETVIRVDRRMTYTAVNGIIADRDEDLMEEYRDFVPMFDLMRELSEIIREKRRARGSIDFEFPESKILLDKEGKPYEIKPYERNAATKLIEDFMLTANETVAEDFYWQQIPFLYRTHEQPDQEKIKALLIFLNNFGYFVHTQQGEVHPKELQKLLDKAEGKTEEALISRLTLRSMRQAKYTAACIGHFGLAAKYYCHFTSPIRRYPDLQIHRIIKESIQGTLLEDRISHYDSILTDVAVQTSMLERRAEEAERETDKLKKCEYMADHIGEVFEGVISGISNWGMYVELPNTVEGMIRISELADDYYVFDQANYQLVGEMTKKTYKLGQKVKVVVEKIDRLLKTIDFGLLEE